MKLGETLPVRRQRLKALNQEHSTETYRVRVQGQRQSLDIHRVGVDFPKYRLDNGRTISAQKEYLAKESSFPEDFFSKDAESAEAQKVQHKILNDMCVRATPNLIKYFADRSQDQPLILDSNGFVVNGNRRLCAMRILYEEDSDLHEQFSHIDVVVLPQGVARKDIYALEVGLQLEEDIKQQYTWTDEASMIRRGREDFDYSDDELAHMYGRTKKKIREMLQALDIADAYLEDREVPREYHRVEDAELTFDKVREGHNKISDESKGEVFEKISYALIDNPDTGLGRLYSVIPDVRTYLEPILEQIKEEIPKTNDKNVATEFEEDFDLLDPDSGSFDDVVAFVREPDNREAVRQATIDIIDDERAQRKSKKRATAAFDLTKQANTKLQEALHVIDQESATSGIEAQLSEIEQTVILLRQKLPEYAQD